MCCVVWFAVIVRLYKGKGEKTECSIYRRIRLSVAGKIYAGILVVQRVTENLIEDDQGCFRAGREGIDQIFTLKQIDEKVREKQCRVYISFMDLEMDKHLW